MNPSEMIQEILEECDAAGATDEQMEEALLVAALDNRPLTLKLIEVGLAEMFGPAAAPKWRDKTS